MSTEVGENFDSGYEAGLDALQALAGSGANERDALAGLMTAVIHAAYAMAPTEEVAEEIITFSQRCALENWEREKG